jgi:hypothetical protein
MSPIKLGSMNIDRVHAALAVRAMMRIGLTVAEIATYL